MTKNSSNSENRRPRRNTYLVLIGSGGEGLYMRTERCGLSDNRSGEKRETMKTRKTVIRFGLLFRG